MKIQKLENAKKLTYIVIHVADLHVYIINMVLIFCNQLPLLGNSEIHSLSRNLLLYWFIIHTANNY